ncbi:MAG: nuclear transport factor 2 family protein, partial [Rhodothermales bacterium]|nr:nuclear transport factor 2 family protein [Rhodothermales bacterium]
MERLFALLLLLGCLPLLATSVAPDPAVPDDEEAAVREAIAHYFRGHATGDGAHFDRAFHPEAKLFWIRDGGFHQRTS